LGDNGAKNHHHDHRQCHQLLALARVLDELGPKRKHFLNAKGKISSEQLRKVEKSNRLVTAQLKKTYFDHFPLLGKLTHMYM